VPFVSLDVRSVSEGCRDTESIVFEDKYEGTVAGCFDGDILETVAENTKYNHNEGNWYRFCYPVEPMAPAMMSNFFGQQVCGLRAGKAFVSVERPNKLGACPSGTSPCSNSTDFEHTVCYASADHKAKCPIIDLKFVTSAADIAYYTDNPEWETEAGMSNYVLVYTRSDANKLPVTTTQISVNPCLKPDSW